MRSYPVKENLIGSSVSEILRYKQTDRQTDIVLLCIIDESKIYYLKVQRIWDGYIRQGYLQHFCSSAAVIRRFSVIWRLRVVRRFRGGRVVGWLGCGRIVGRLGSGWVVRGFGGRRVVWRGRRVVGWGGCIVGRFGGGSAVAVPSSVTAS